MASLKDFTFLYQLSQQAAPLAAKDVGSGQAAISTAHTQVGDAFRHQVKGSSEPALMSREGLASGATDHRPTLRSFNKVSKQVGANRTLVSGTDEGQVT